MERSPILVLQMAKVASYAWYEAIRRACPEREVLHLHTVRPDGIARLRNQARSGTRRVPGRLLGLIDEATEARLRSAIDGGRPIKIVSGIRDPVDRAASVFFFHTEFYRDAPSIPSPRRGASVEELLSYFHQAWRKALSGDTPTAAFDAWLQTGFIAYRDWFDRQIRDVFALDVTSAAFDRQRGVLTAASGPVDLVCYRFEDLAAGNAATRRVIDTISAFLDVPIDALPPTNKTEQRQTRDLYRDFRSRLRLPADTVEAIFSPAILSTFYDAAELDAMKRRWRQ